MLYLKTGLSDNATYENAFAYILGKYTGVTLSKQGEDGNFKSIYVKGAPAKKASKNSNPVLPATSICK